MRARRAPDDRLSGLLLDRELLGGVVGDPSH
jgi:hypothetical protein